MDPAPTSGLAVCPQCGGENRLPSGQRIIKCNFCDTSLYADRSTTVSYYSVPRLLDEKQAHAALRRWMAGNETVKDLDQKSTIEQTAPMSFPVWMFRVDEPSGEVVHIEPAAAPPIPPLADLKVPAGELEWFAGDSDSATTIEVTVPMETARGWIEGQATGAMRESALVQVPLWECHYRFEDRSYTALVDASTGSVLAAVFPEKAESPFYLVAGLGILLFGIEGLVIFNPLAKLLAYLVTAVPMTLLAYWVARKV